MASAPASVARCTSFTAVSKLWPWLPESSATTNTGCPGPITCSPMRIEFAAFAFKSLLNMYYAANQLKGLGGPATDNRTPAARHYLQTLQRTGMGKDLYLGFIARHGALLKVDSRFYVKERVGLKGRGHTMERPIGGRRDLKHVQVANTMAFDGPGGGQHRPMRHGVVHIKIGTTVRENCVGSMFLNQFLHDLNHVENRKRVETIVRQVIQEQIFDPKHVGGASTVFAQIAQQRRVRLLPGAVTGRHTFAQDGDLNVVSLRHQTRHSSTAAQNLIIRMGCDHQNRPPAGETLRFFGQPFCNRPMSLTQIERFLQVTLKSDGSVFVGRIVETLAEGNAHGPLGIAEAAGCTHRDQAGETWIHFQ